MERPISAPIGPRQTVEKLQNKHLVHFPVGDEFCERAVACNVETSHQWHFVSLATCECDTLSGKEVRFEMLLARSVFLLYLMLTEKK